MPGKVLRGHQHGPHRVSALDERPDVGRHLLRVFPIGADVDDGVLRIAVHVGDRRQNPWHAQCNGLAGSDLAFKAAQAGIPRGGKGHGVREERFGFQAHGVSALEVPGHQQGELRGSLHAVEERPHGVGLGGARAAVLHSIGEHQSAHVQAPHLAKVLLVLFRTGIRRVSEEGDHYQLRGFLLKRHRAHPALHDAAVGFRGRRGALAGRAGRGRGSTGSQEEQGEQRLRGPVQVSSMPSAMGGFPVRLRRFSIALCRGAGPCLFQGTALRQSMHRNCRSHADKKGTQAPAIPRLSLAARVSGLLTAASAPRYSTRVHKEAL